MRGKHISSRRSPCSQVHNILNHACCPHQLVTAQEITRPRCRPLARPSLPGIFEPAHVDGWRQVTEAVHSQGGIMFSQLWHVGRVSHPHFQPGEALPISSSAVPISFDGQPGKVFSPKTMQARGGWVFQWIRCSLCDAGFLYCGWACSTAAYRVMEQLCSPWLCCRWRPLACGHRLPCPCVLHNVCHAPLALR